MKNVQNDSGVKNIFDLNLKEVNGRYETENLRHEHIKKKKESKMTKRESFEKYDSFSENELNTKSNKEVYVKIMSWLLLSNIADAKKKGAKEKWTN